jgi:hypothetical protein
MDPQPTQRKPEGTWPELSTGEPDIYPYRDRRPLGALGFCLRCRLAVLDPFRTWVVNSTGGLVHSTCWTTDRPGHVEYRRGADR